VCSEERGRVGDWLWKAYSLWVVKRSPFCYFLPFYFFVNFFIIFYSLFFIIFIHYFIYF